MNLMPPSRQELKSNLSLLAADWRAGTALMRYFVVSQLASTLLSATCSLLSVVALVLDDGPFALGLACIAGGCLMHAYGTWAHLKRRYQVRFAIW